MKSLNIILPSVAVILLLLMVLIFPSRINGIVDKFTPEATVRTDTVTILRTVTVRDTVARVVYRERVRTDTMVYAVRDTVSGDTVKITVPIPIERAEFTGKVDTLGTYKAIVEGYKPQLKSIEFDLTLPERTVKRTVKEKAPRWNVGIVSGFGYGIFNKKPDLFVGLGIVYRL
jgi:hypothetical protein